MSSTPASKHVALQFGHIKHFSEGLSEFSRQLALQHAAAAPKLRAELGWQFHFILPQQWHGMFGDAVTYHDLTDAMRWRHSFPVDLDVWHGMHQHMRYRPPINCRSALITVHDLNHVYAKTGLSLWWQNMRLTRQLRRAQRLIAISQYVAQDIRRCLPWAPPTTLIYNGAADLTQAPQLRPPAWHSRDYLLHLSRMSPSKNMESLIDMAQVWPEQHLLLVGPDNPEVQAHRERARLLGLQNIHFLTDVNESEKAWLYAHCQGFLFPSLAEGFGLPPVEAMHFGKPVFLSRLTSLPEVGGPVAHYFDSFDGRAMRRVVEAGLLADAAPGRAQAIAAHAHQFSWRRCATAHIAQYEQMMQRPSGELA